MLPVIADGGNPLGFLTQFGVEWRLLLSQALSFAIVAAALYFFVFKRVIKVSALRREEIAKGLRDSQEDARRLAEAETEAGKKLKEAAAEAAATLRQAHDDAKRAIDAAAHEASEKAAEIRARSEEQIEADKKRMMEELKAELAGLVVKASEAVVAEVLTDEQRGRLAEIAAEKLEK